MRNRFYSLGDGMLVAAILSSVVLLSCQQMHPAAQPATQPTTAPVASVSTLSADDLRDFLAWEANAHNDKIKLSWWVSTPLRPVDPPYRAFFENMGKQNKALLAELKEWAKVHHVDLKYHLGTDLDGRAQKIMNDRQEKLVRDDDKINFEHDILMQMYTDYEWNLSQIQAALPGIRDGALKTYLEKSLKMYTDGSAEIMGLLRRYKFQ